MRIEFTRSRPRCSNANGLDETKNGAVIRKLFGYDHIPQRHAVRFDNVCCEQLNPFLNFHRPCLFPIDRPDPKKPGRVKRVYRPQDAMTPLTKLASLPDAQGLPPADVTLSGLFAKARALTDLQAAKQLKAARLVLCRPVTARAATAPAAILAKRAA